MLQNFICRLKNCLDHFLLPFLGEFLFPLSEDFLLFFPLLFALLGLLSALEVLAAFADCCRLCVEVGLGLAGLGCSCSAGTGLGLLGSESGVAGLTGSTVVGLTGSGSGLLVVVESVVVIEAEVSVAAA